MADRLNLVTGATGFTGSHLMRDLLARGERVIGTDLASAFDNPEATNVASKIGLDRAHPRLELVPADLLSTSSLDALFERPITRIFHTASLYDYSAPLDRLRRVNVEGTRHLLERASRIDLERFVHWSTCGVFGKPYTAAHGHKVNLPFTEDSSSPRNTEGPRPRNTELVNDYSISKWEQEQLVWKYYRDEGLPVTVVRPAPIYGPGSDYGHGGIVLAVAQGLVSAVPTDAKNYVTTSVHVEDVAGFACFIAERDDAVGEDYNIVDDSVISYLDFIQYIALLTGRRVRQIPFVRLDIGAPLFNLGAKAWRALETRFGVPRVRVFEVGSSTYVSSSYWIDNRKSRDAGYEYRYPDVRDGLRDTIKWLRENGWLLDRKRLFVVAPGGAKP